MNEFYYEISIRPNALSEIFASEIMEFTNEAIEEDSMGNIIVRTPNDIVDSLISFLHNLSQNLSQINGININFTHTSSKKPNKDYIQQYKDSVSAIDCGIFHIYPPWLKPQDSQINIILEPSLAFGTGHHASTFMCIEALQSCHITQDTTLLDVGCGSGILALCANKLGANVSMCDIDELAIAESKKNFALNNATITDIWLGGIEKINEKKPHKKYDIVIANIVASVIIEQATYLISTLKDNAYLILSGILNTYAESVKYHFRDLHIQEEKQLDEWVCLKLSKQQTI